MHIQYIIYWFIYDGDGVELGLLLKVPAREIDLKVVEVFAI
jgi:hypothetical protein